MGQDLTTTSYALLGLLMFDGGTRSDGLTGYELKQRADNTLRYYWVSPAMSQVYSELDRLHRQGFVEVADEKDAASRTRRFRITDDGEGALRHWLTTTDVGFPILKHPVALRLLMGHLAGPGVVDDLLGTYVEALTERRKELEEVRQSLDEGPDHRYPALVADWGLAYYDAESRVVEELRDRLRQPAEEDQARIEG